MWLGVFNILFSFCKNVQWEKIPDGILLDWHKGQVCLLWLLNIERSYVLGNITGLSWVDEWEKVTDGNEAAASLMDWETGRTGPDRCTGHSHTGADSKWGIIYCIWASVVQWVICHPIITFLLNPFSDALLQGSVSGYQPPVSGREPQGHMVKYDECFLVP